MKLKLLLTVLIMLTLVSKVSAVDGALDDVVDDTLTVDNVQSANIESSRTADSDTGNSLSWTAIPGESLNDVARAFYPNNKDMQRLFIAKTLQLNPEIEPKLKPSMVFEAPTLLTIPTLKLLSKSRQAANTSQRAKIASPDLSMSYDMGKVAANLPALLKQEYELLLSKNDFLKAELERLHIRINVLQTKLGHLKLMLDKTLNKPDKQATATDLTTNNNPPEVQHVANIQSAKKSFKNLNENSANENKVNSVNTAVKQVKPLTQQSPVLAILAIEKVEESSSNLLKYSLLAALGLLALLALGAYLLKEYRQRVVARFNESVPTMDDTLTDLGRQWQRTEQEAAAEYVAEHQPQVSTKSFINTQIRDEQARATSTLEEAKLLMSINRAQDAIDHLKLIIEMQPKNSINHWLYLLEIFRTLGLKEDFEHYAQNLQRTFNVMTPVWYETNAAIVVPQDLEEFPHIMDKLDAVWPSNLAKVYLESLITDNRDGDRAGFSQAVLDDILMLIALLDTRRAFD